MNDLLLPFHNYFWATAADMWVSGVYTEVWLSFYIMAGDLFMAAPAQGWSRLHFLVLCQIKRVSAWMRAIHSVVGIVDNWTCSSIKNS